MTNGQSRDTGRTRHSTQTDKRNKYKTAQKTKFGSRILRNEEVNLITDI
jgi:hypothetical protein